MTERREHEFQKNTVGDFDPSSIDGLHQVFGHNHLHSDRRVMPVDIDAESAQIWLANRIADHKLNGAFIAFVAGGFDVPHDCHEWYLRHCRMMAAIEAIKAQNEELTLESVRTMMRSDKLCLVVSIDSDKALDARKGGKDDKGGVPRPIYPWESRSQRIAGYSYTDPTTEEVIYIADIVSRECTVDFNGEILQSAKTVVEWLEKLGLADLYVVYGEHPHDEQAAMEIGIKYVKMPSETVYAVDPRTGKMFTSSGMIRLMQGRA